MEILIALKEYSPFLGLYSSPWIGLDNFERLFNLPEFQTLLTNTVVIKVSYIIVTGLLAFGLSLALSSLRSNRLRHGLSTLFLVPFFIPSLIFASAVIYILSPSLAPIFPIRSLLLVETSWYRPIHVLVESVKTCGIPLLMALAAISSRTHEATYTRRKIIPAALAIAAFVILQLSTLLSTDFELSYILNNPIVYAVGDTLQTFQYRLGLLNGDYSLAAAVTLFQFVIQAVLTLFAYWLLRRFFKPTIFNENQSPKPTNNSKSKSAAVSWGIAPLIFYSLVVLLPLYMIFVYPFLQGTDSTSSIGDVFSLDSFGRYLFLYVCIVVISSLVNLTLAYPLTVRDLPGKAIYKVFLLLLLVMGNGTIAEYLLVREMSLVNTLFSQIPFGLVQILSVFVLKGVFNSKYSGLKDQAAAEGQSEWVTFFVLFIPRMWKTLLALAILQFSMLWGSFYHSLIFLNNELKYSPVGKMLLLFQGGSSSGLKPGDPLILMYAAIICLPPILLLLLFRKYLTAETFLSQIRRL